VYVYTGMLDMRVGMDRLAEKVATELGRRVMEGGYFRNGQTIVFS
jgi:hypothetical protein